MLKHFPTSIATQLGHTKQEHQCMRSTKPLPSLSLSSTIYECHFPMFDLSCKFTNDVVHTMHATKDKDFIDLTSRLICKSSRRNDHIIIAYHFDGNAIVGR